MGEERVGEKKSLNASPAEQQATIQSVAEKSEFSLKDASLPLPQPKLPSIPSLPKPSMASNTAKLEEAKQWNTSKLGLRSGVDFLAAASAGILVAPVITIIDKGIMENASGRNTLGESLKSSAKEVLLKPHRFLSSKPFALIMSLYFGTYFTANTIDTVSSTINSTKITDTTAGSTKFVAVSSANLALCLYKDNRFTQMFGSASSARPVGLPTFALFTVRDCLTIFASFNLPPLIAPKLEQKMSEEARKYISAASAAQFFTPAAVQIVSTPLHLLGLDLYNRPGARMVGPDGRTARVVRDWAKAALARMGRIIPAFGVGGVVNTKVRRNFMQKLEGKA